MSTAGSLKVSFASPLIQQILCHNKIRRRWCHFNKHMSLQRKCGKHATISTNICHFNNGNLPSKKTFTTPTSLCWIDWRVSTVSEPPRVSPVEVVSVFFHVSGGRSRGFPISMEFPGSLHRWLVAYNQPIADIYLVYKWYILPIGWSYIT